jgi:5-methylcytosine-specific restriction endonuclease McrBC regulatory subunit McrC
MAKIKKPGFPSEISGYCEGVFIPPKSFEGLKNDSKGLVSAYNGLFYLIGNIAKNKNFTYEANFRQGLELTSSPLAFQVVLSLLGILEELRKTPSGSFQKKTEFSNAFKGRVNFSKSIQRSRGLKDRTFKKYNQLHFRSTSRDFLVLALPIVGERLMNYLTDANRENVSAAIRESMFLLSDAPVGRDLFENALAVLQEGFGRGSEEKLLSYSRVLAIFILNRHGIHSTRDELNCHAPFDFLLNLNRPFESLLKKIVKKTEKWSAYDSGKGKFSNVHFNKNNGALIKTVPMKPDVWATSGGELLILDAKHKVFYKDLFDGTFRDTAILSREDIYQMVSYIRTNSISQEAGVFGLFGLKEERTLSDVAEKLIDCEMELEIDLVSPGTRDEKKIKIKILTMKFGSVLREIGKILETRREKDLEKFFGVLANQLTDALA